MAAELDAERSQRASDILFGQAKSGQIEECLEQLASALSGSSLVHELAAKECVGVRLVDVLANVLYRDQSKSTARQPEPVQPTHSAADHFRALLKSGAVEINGRRITDPLYVMRPHDFRAGKSLVKSGKQAFCMLSLSPQEAACHAAAA